MLYKRIESCVVLVVAVHHRIFICKTFILKYYSGVMNSAILWRAYVNNDYLVIYLKDMKTIFLLNVYESNTFVHVYLLTCLRFYCYCAFISTLFESHVLKFMYLYFRDTKILNNVYYCTCILISFGWFMSHFENVCVRICEIHFVVMILRNTFK